MRHLTGAFADQPVAPFRLTLAAPASASHRRILADRAPIFSAIYLLSYSGAAIPALVAGQLSYTFSLPQIAFGYGALALVGHRVRCHR